MDVFIKSFNRPYYLDRCLFTIEKYLEGDYNIIILDDGTPEKYLSRIKEKYPKVTIRKSNLHAQKVKAIEDHLLKRKEFNIKEVPSVFWKENIKNGTSVFLLLEEDAWLTEKILLHDVTSSFKTENLATLKLNWASNEMMVNGVKSKINDWIEWYAPTLPTHNPFLLQLIATNTLKIRSVIRRIPFLTKQLIFPYYSLYTVSSAFFLKNFWLDLWDKPSTLIEEEKQLLAALHWRLKSPGGKFAKGVEQLVNTSYISTSINPFSAIHFDFIRFNSQLNEAWYQEELNIAEGLPRDFSIHYLAGILKEAGMDDETFQLWTKWITMFKGQFISQGCVID